MTTTTHRLQHLDRHLRDRRLAQPLRLRRPARDGDEGARLVQRVRGHRDDRRRRTRPNSSVQVTITVDSIDTRNKQRDDHIRTNDFLDVANHPKITFASTSIEHDGGNDFEVTGDLTIRGVTKSITLPLEFQGSASDPFGNERIGFEGSVVINRKDWGVNWNAALEAGGVLVSEKVTLEFEISADQERLTRPDRATFCGADGRRKLHNQRHGRPRRPARQVPAAPTVRRARRAGCTTPP